MIKIKKICSFYVSDWHLVTMLLPYINRQIDEKAKIDFANNKIIWLIVLTGWRHCGSLLSKDVAGGLKNGK